MKLEEYIVILEREGFRRIDDSFWHDENMFAFVGFYDSLNILPDFNYDKKEKRWYSY